LKPTGLKSSVEMFTLHVGFRRTCMSSTVGLAANVKVVSTSPVLPSSAMLQILAVRSADTVKICNNHTGYLELRRVQRELPLGGFTLHCGNVSRRSQRVQIHDVAGNKGR
jgi:hypothetical protein